MLPLLLGLQLAHTAPLGQLAKRNTLWVDAVPQVHGLVCRMELDFTPPQADTLVQLPYLLYGRYS